MEFFDAIRQEIHYQWNADGSTTPVIVTKFECSECGAWLDKNYIENYIIPCTVAGTPDLPKIKFICEDCYEKVINHE